MKNEIKIKGYVPADQEISGIKFDKDWGWISIQNGEGHINIFKDKGTKFNYRKDEWPPKRVEVTIREIKEADGRGRPRKQEGLTDEVIDHNEAHDDQGTKLEEPDKDFPGDDPGTPGDDSNPQEPPK